jgi:hypothetical protein
VILQTRGFSQKLVRERFTFVLVEQLRDEILRTTLDFRSNEADLVEDGGTSLNVLDPLVSVQRPFNSSFRVERLRLRAPIGSGVRAPRALVKCLQSTRFQSVEPVAPSLRCPLPVCDR